MAHGERAQRKENAMKESYSARPGNYGGGSRSVKSKSNKWRKRWTHKVERQREKRALHKGRIG